MKSSLHTEAKDMANALRALTIDAVEQAQSGHPGMPMGMADVLYVLCNKHLKFYAAAPDWPDRDRLILSAGHGSMLLYSMLYLTGYTDFTLDELKQFRKLGARTAGHPEYGAGKGIETTTGPLGQGLANAVGMALAERIMAANFGDDLVNHRTYVIVGDGCLMEGISHEAASIAGHLKLNKLIVLYDDNGISIDGPTELCNSDDTTQRFSSYGWHVISVDGHDVEMISAAISEAKATDKPSLISCRTVIGYGSPKKAGTSAAHGAPLGEMEAKASKNQLGWPHASFEIPEHILSTWRQIGIRHKTTFSEWEGKLSSNSEAIDFERRISGELPVGWSKFLNDWKQESLLNPKEMPTRKASGNVLQQLNTIIPELIGGSADLTPSNNTYVNQSVITKDSYKGNYIHYGVREHAMAAVMNGMALHKGVIPYGGSFLVFSDYCKPAIRLSSLMKQRVIYVMTHDSIGLGEDGPTHQPIEHLSSLRAIPNLWVFRPCDAIETAECWQLALERLDGPSVLCLTRQALPQLRETATENLCSLGGYVLGDVVDDRDITLVASGSEVSLAIYTKNILSESNIKAAVVSMPCHELFAMQAENYQKETIPDVPFVAIEAGIDMSWHRYAKRRSDFVCINTFGASAPSNDLFEKFGFTATSIAKRCHDLLNK